MSHTVQVKNIKCTNEAALEIACDRLGLELSAKGRHRMFDGSHAEGRSLKLPNWHQPVVINTETGMCSYDNYGGTWGDQIELDKLMQRYSIEELRLQAQAQGLSVDQEQELEDGSVKLALVDYSG